MKLSDLVLVYCTPSITHLNFISVERITNPDLKIDLKKENWSYKEIKDVPIGKKREKFDIHYIQEPIGIYDRTDITHLIQMVNDLVLLGKINNF